MDERDIQLINEYPLSFMKEWTPDDLAEWRDHVEHFTEVDRLNKIHRKLYASRENATSIILAIKFLDKTEINPERWKEYIEFRKICDEEDEKFWIHHGIDRKSEEWFEYFDMRTGKERQADERP